MAKILGLNTLDSRIYYKKWCRSLMNEQFQTTRTVRKLLKNNPYSGLFGGHGERIDKILQRYEKSFW